MSYKTLQDIARSFLGISTVQDLLDLGGKKGHKSSGVKTWKCAAAVEEKMSLRSSSSSSVSVTKIMTLFVFTFLMPFSVAANGNKLETPVSEKLVSMTGTGDIDVRVESKPEAPYWSKPERMERMLYAEPLNSVVRLRCQAGGYPTPSIRWLKDGISIEHVDRPYPLRPYTVKPEKWELRIPGLIKADEGNYTCDVSNSYGRIQHTYTVETLRFLTHKPVLVGQSDNVTVLEGMNADMYCTFQSDLTSFTQWMRPATGLRGENYTTLFDEHNPSHYENVLDQEGVPFMGESITMKAVTTDDAGPYFCIGYTNVDRSFGVLHLTVLRRDEALVEQPRNLSVEAGENAVFTCKTHKALREHTSWVRIVEEDLIVLAEGTEVLRIDNVTENSQGLYACVVGTDVAQIQALAHLTVVEHPLPTYARDHKRLKVIAGSVSALTLILLVVVVIVIRRWQREKVKKQQAVKNAHAVTQWTKKVIIERQSDLIGPDSPIIAPVIRIEKQNSSVNLANRSRLGSENTTLTTISEYELPLDPDWEFPRDQLDLNETLGEGAFGKVVKATAIQILRTENVTEVAVKMLKEGHTDNDMIDLVSEMDMMKMIGRHINIINLLGVCTQDGPLYVIVEFAEHGNLRDFLRQHSDVSDGYERPNSERPIISERQLISFARQICKGMEYLGSMKCIHRDLAARNVLVAKDYVIKIADFGLARDVHKNDYYKKLGDGWLPVRWMAPEALFQRRYTTRSDVWSFGVLLWEIMTLGASPYPSVPSVERLFQLLREGHRMERPPNCSIDVYMIMRECWNAEPTHRPSFVELVEDFDRLLTLAREGDYLDMGFPSPPVPSQSTGETLVMATNTDLSTASSWGTGPIDYSQGLLAMPPLSAAPRPPSNDMSYQNSSMSSSSGHGTSNEGSVTYTPLMATYCNNNMYSMVQPGLEQQQKQQPLSTFRPNYVNHPPKQYCDVQHPSTTMDELDAEESLTLDDYSEKYSDHFQSSAL